MGAVRTHESHFAAACGGSRRPPSQGVLTTNSAAVRECFCAPKHRGPDILYNPTMNISRRMFLSAAAAAPFTVKAATLSEVPISVLTDEIDEDLAHDAEFLHGFGIKWAELRSIWGKYNTVQPVEKIREARSILDAKQIRTSVVGTAFFRIPLPPEGAAGQAILDK